MDDTPRKASTPTRIRPVVIKSVEFPSPTAAARHYGFTRHAVIVRLNSRSKKYKDWQYKDSGENP